MGKPAVIANNLGKQYKLGLKQSGYGSFRESLMEFATAPLRCARTLFADSTAQWRSDGEWMWALKDVSFQISRGEVVGIIGRNGAGKSTLLKILSQVTDPTEGGVDIYGRVGSLLEVGTGFHPELTGRENVYMNGAILGMKRAEIDRKFDEIVAFAEVEKFIDTPVKHYSSGMYLRLAFAVAAHLEPEILIVDEVLAVGDVAFQKKCLGKMAGVASEGRTVLFVSHNMPAITRLCERTILLGEGRLLQDGPSHEVVRTYLNAGVSSMAERAWENPGTAPHGEIARLRAVRIRTDDGRCAETIDIRKPVALEMEFEVLKSGYAMMPSFHLHNEESLHVFSTVEQDPLWRRRPRPLGRYRSTAWIPGNFLAEGTLFIDAGLTTLEPMILQFFERQAVAFQVIDSSDGDTARGEWGGRFGGTVRPLLRWTTAFTEDARIEALT